MLSSQQTLLINVFFELSNLSFHYEQLLFYKPSLAPFLLKVNNENNEANGYLCSHDWQRLLEQESAQKQWLGYKNVTEYWNQSPFLTFKQYHFHLNHDNLL